jgi:hypothetical protein
MAASTFQAVVNSKCRVCPVRTSCPVSGKGRQVVEPPPPPRPGPAQGQGTASAPGGPSQTPPSSEQGAASSGGQGAGPSGGRGAASPSGEAASGERHDPGQDGPAAPHQREAGDGS